MTRGETSLTSAIKGMANVILGPKGTTISPLDNLIKMQHFQLWGFLLVIIAIVIIIWLIQKKFDSIDKQYKELIILNIILKR